MGICASVSGFLTCSENSIDELLKFANTLLVIQDIMSTAWNEAYFNLNALPAIKGLRDLSV